MSRPIGPSGALSGRTVLVVEDDYFIADETRRMLTTGGAVVLGPAASVDGALALIAASPELDAAVLDINLRDIMVFPVADALAARGVPFVFTTGYDGALIPAHHVHVPRCEKPVGSGTLVRALSAQVGGP